MAPLRLLAGLLACALLLLPAPAPAATTTPASDATTDATLPLAGGAALRLEADPFRLVLLDDDGSEAVATVPAELGSPVRVPGIDGPQPEEPLGALGGFPAIGFVVGAQADQTFPIAVPFFTGNRLFGAEAGAIVSVVALGEVEHGADGTLRAELLTDAPSLPPATLDARPLPGGGVRVDIEPPDGLPAISSMFTLDSPADEGLYGMGGRKDAFDQRGLLRNLWVEQQNIGAGPFRPITDNDPTGVTGPTYTFPNGQQATHFPQAVLFGSRGWATWVRESVLQRIDLAASRDDAVRWGIARPDFSLLLAGGGLEEASRAFTADQGRAPAPPRYAYEPWVSILNQGEGEAAPHGAGFDGGERVRDDVVEVTEMAARHDLPIGVIGMEGWQTIPDIAEFADDLRAQGYRLSAYWSPFINGDAAVYDEAEANGYLVQTPTGDPYPIITTRGNANFLVDFTNPEARAWWGRLLEWSNDLGFEAFMHDFGELVTEGMVFSSGEPAEVVHNAFPVLYHRAAREAQDRYAAANPGFEPFFFLRAGFTGFDDHPGATAYTPSAFPGDETTDDDDGFGLPAIVPMMLNLALGGSYAFTTDVGGYMDLLTPQTDAELFTRWQQAAALMPISRIHNSTFNGSVMPWDFDEDTLDAYRRYARAKVALIDLVDDWSQEAAAEGAVGPVRPLVLDDPSPEARGIGDQWLLGTDILVAPVLYMGQREREVWLPAGSRWQQVTVDAEGAFAPLGEPHDGGRRITAAAPLADIPIFLRVADDATEPPPPAPEPTATPTAEAAPPPEAPRPDRALPATGGGPATAALVLLLAGLLLAATRRGASS